MLLTFVAGLTCCCCCSIHAPHQAPPEYEARYNSSTPDWDSYGKQKVMAMMLSALDDGVANVSAALKATGQAENTVVVLSADNGPPAPNPRAARRSSPLSLFGAGARSCLPRPPRARLG